MKKQPLSLPEQDKIKHVWWSSEKCKGTCDRTHPNGCWVLHVNGEAVYDTHWSPVILRGAK